MQARPARARAARARAARARAARARAARARDRARARRRTRPPRSVGALRSPGAFFRALEPFSVLTRARWSSFQVVVLGESSALASMELLEKRVRSRFSGRQVLFMPPPCPARALDILCDALLAPPNVVPAAAPAAASPAAAPRARGNGKEPASPEPARAGDKRKGGAAGASGAGGPSGAESRAASAGGAEGRFARYRARWNARVEALRAIPEMHLAVEEVCPSAPPPPASSHPARAPTAASLRRVRVLQPSSHPAPPAAEPRAPPPPSY